MIKNSKRRWDLEDDQLLILSYKQLSTCKLIKKLNGL